MANIINKFSSILFFLIIPNLIFGPAIPDILLTCIGLIILYIIIVYKRFDLINNIYSYLFFIWFLYLIIRSALSIDPYLSFTSSLFYFRFYFFALGILFLIQKDDFFKKYLFYVIIFTYLFILTISLLQFFFENIEIPFIDQYEIYKYHFHMRLKGPFADSIMGGYLIKLLPLLFISYYISPKFMYKNYLLIFIFLLSSLVIILTGERNAFLLLFLFNILILFNKSIDSFYKFITFALFILVFVISVILYPALISRIVFTINQFNFLNTDGILTNIYFKYFINAYFIFKENILFGAGPKMFRILCNDYVYLIPDSCSTHPHNIYFQLLAETGLFSFFIFLSLFIFSFYKFIRLKIYSSRKHYNIMFYSFLSIIILLFPFSTANNLFNNYVNIFYFIYLSFFINALNLQNETKTYIA